MDYEPKHKKLHAALLVVAVILFLRAFVIEGFFVQGDSMYPTLHSGDYVLVNKMAYWWGEPERGDVVVAKVRPSTELGIKSEKVVKRVMGLPSEWFDIDGKTQNVDPREYYLVGDNAEVSVDSRVLGSVDDWDLAGRVFGALSFDRLKYLDF